MPVGSKPTHEKQYDEDDQDDADDANAAVAIAVAITAEPAAESAEQEDDEDNDEDESERHDAVLFVPGSRVSDARRCDGAGLREPRMGCAF